MKAATFSIISPVHSAALISIHAAREGGDDEILNHSNTILISIHAAREGGDYALIAVIVHDIIFQSTPPVKAATFTRCVRRQRANYFNPRRP